MLTYKDIISCYFKLFQPSIIPTSSEANSIIKLASRYERQGWTLLQITRLLSKYHYNILLNSNFNKPIYFKNLQEIFYMKYNNKSKLIFDNSIPNKKPPFTIKTNLLNPNTFYYHKALQLLPQRKNINIDDEGNIISSKIIPYLEIKDYFEIDDLVNYFNKRLNMQINDTMYEYNKKVFGGLLNDEISLDIILFTIDIAARREYIRSDYYSAANLRQHLNDGYNLYTNIKMNKKGEVKPFYIGYLDFIYNNEIKEGGK